MTNNIFFFREEDYSVQEMRNRIPPEQINPETAEVMEILEELNEVPSETSSLSKNPHLDLVREECTPERYTEYISTLFDKYGKRGDRFNLQMFELKGSSIQYEELITSTEGLVGTDVSNRFSDLRDLPLALQNVKGHQENKIIDFSFQTIESEERLTPTEDLPIVVYRDGEQVTTFSEPNYEVMAPATYRIEARVYVEEDLVAVSNFSSVRDGDQSDIVEIIGSLGRTNEEESNE